MARAALALGALAFLVAAAAAFAVTGQLTQLQGPAGKAGCVSQDGSAGACADGRALDGPQTVAASADGKSVYLTSYYSQAIAVFRRATNGLLTQLSGPAGCVSETGSDPSDPGTVCTDAKALGTSTSGPRAIAVSSDGKSVYATAYLRGAVAVFQRDTTSGQLTQLPGTAGCVSQTGSNGACADGEALSGPTDVTVSEDGKNVYVSSHQSAAVAVFERNQITGELTQLPGQAGCISESGGACRDGKLLARASSVAVSGDGENVYATSLNGPGEKCDYATYCAVAVFSRDSTTGELSQLAGTAGCVSQTGSHGLCVDGRTLGDANSVAVSPDGKTVYVTAGGSKGVAIFRRNATTGALTQLAGKAGCVTERGSNGACADGKALDNPDEVAVSADGQSAYVTSGGSDAVAAFKRGPTVGALMQLDGLAGCTSETGSDPFDPSTTCTDGKALDAAVSVIVSPDNKNVYVASFNDDAVAVFRRELPPAAP